MKENNLILATINLIRRLATKYHRPQIVKKIATLAIVGALALSIAGCDEYDIIIRPKDPNQTNPPVTDTNPDDNSSEQSKPSIDQYSEILQNVLTNDYYNSLIDSARGGNYELYTSGKFQPHPYAFLEDEGFDVEAIENKQLDCYTMSYVLDEEPNNLYMYTRVNDGSVVHNYLLKYELTDQEMDDYDLTHCDRGTLASYFIESVFMNNEISKTRDPISVEESKMTVQAFEEMTKSMSKLELVNTNSCYIIMTNPNPKEFSFDLKLVPFFFGDNQMKYDSTLIDLLCTAQITTENNIYSWPYLYNSQFSASAMSKYKAKFYFTQNASIVSAYSCPSLTD